ncbi:hypothetical protein [Streptomyces sp. N35]|uniref:hypothetical protein n=1 Tax=Streptomyces sp. N35 TaxID=2795730 RepID=UPI0018F33F93|nr:hypothetical protein [Streptomyces sp. N35]
MDSAGLTQVDNSQGCGALARLVPNDGGVHNDGAGDPAYGHAESGSMLRLGGYGNGGQGQAGSGGQQDN